MIDWLFAISVIILIWSCMFKIADMLTDMTIKAFDGKFKETNR